MDANTIIAISSIVTPLTIMVATILVARTQQRTERNVNLGNLATTQIHEEVKTSNGVALGALTERSAARDDAIDAANGKPTAP